MSYLFTFLAAVACPLAALVLVCDGKPNLAATWLIPTFCWACLLAFRTWEKFQWDRETERLAASSKRQG